MEAGGTELLLEESEADTPTSWLVPTDPAPSCLDKERVELDPTPLCDTDDMEAQVIEGAAGIFLGDDDPVAAINSGTVAAMEKRGSSETSPN